MSTKESVDPLPASLDGDYVACFQAMTEVEVAIRKEGPRAPLLLRRSMLALEMGDLKRGIEAAQDAVAAAPRDAEAHFHEGQAWLALARYEAGVTILGPAVDLPPSRALHTLLTSAYEAFCAAVRCRPQDPDAKAELAFVEGLVDQEEEAVSRALHRRITTA